MIFDQNTPKNRKGVNDIVHDLRIWDISVVLSGGKKLKPPKSNDFEGFSESVCIQSKKESLHLTNFIEQGYNTP